MFLTPEQKESLTKVIEKYNHNGTGNLSPAEFTNFLVDSFAKDEQIQEENGYIPQMNHEIAEFVFKGITNESKETATISEIIKLIEIISGDDIESQVKLLFKSLDPDRTGVVKVADLVDAAKLFGVDLTRTVFMDSIRKKYGIAESTSVESILIIQITFIEFHQIIMYSIRETINITETVEQQVATEGNIESTTITKPRNDPHVIKSQEKALVSPITARENPETAKSACCLLL